MFFPRPTFFHVEHDGACPVRFVPWALYSIEFWVRDGAIGEAAEV